MLGTQQWTQWSRCPQRWATAYYGSSETEWSTCLQWSGPGRRISSSSSCQCLSFTPWETVPVAYCPPKNLRRGTHKRLNTYACQHPKLQGPEEKFSKVLSRKNREIEIIKKKEHLSKGRSGQGFQVCLCCLNLAVLRWTRAVTWLPRSGQMGDRVGSVDCPWLSSNVFTAEMASLSNNYGRRSC